MSNSLIQQLIENEADFNNHLVASGLVSIDHGEKMHRELREEWKKKLSLMNVYFIDPNDEEEDDNRREVREHIENLNKLAERADADNARSGRSSPHSEAINSPIPDHLQTVEKRAPKEFVLTRETISQLDEVDRLRLKDLIKHSKLSEEERSRLQSEID